MPSPKHKPLPRVSARTAMADPSMGWTAHQWGAAIAAAVHAEVRQSRPVALSKIDPALRRAVGQAIQREVTSAIERVAVEVKISAVKEVISLIAEGRSDQEITRRLGISLTTIRDGREAQP